MVKVTHLRSQSRRLLRSPKKLGRLRPLHIPHLLIVQEPNARAPPYNPISIVLSPLSAHLSPISRPSPDKKTLTSFLVTGFSNNTKWVSRAKLRNGSKSASSAKLLDVKTRFRRFGSEVARLGWILLMRLRARRRVCRRGERGKLERVGMSLSVKSMASWSCSAFQLDLQSSPARFCWGYSKEGRTFATPRFSMAGILCPARLGYDINGAHLFDCKCSICSFQLVTHL